MSELKGKEYRTYKLIHENGASIIELNSVNDEKHKHFYSKLSYYETKNFVVMGKFLEET